MTMKGGRSHDFLLTLPGRSVKFLLLRNSKIFACKGTDDRDR
jgi:hypothetical protein